jgi:hypothetical protein
MSSKTWIERAITQPASTPAQPPDSKRARLAELLLKTKKEKG